MTVAQIRKFIVAALAAVSILVVSLGEVFGDWFSDDAAAWINTAIAIVGAVGVYLVRNAGVIDAIGTGAYRQGQPPPPPTVG